MFKRFAYIVGIALLALTMMAPSFPAQTAFAGDHLHGSEFVKRLGPWLWLQGRPFRFAGTNNYYPMYKSQFMVDDVLQRAADNDFRVEQLQPHIENYVCATADDHGFLATVPETPEAFLQAIGFYITMIR